MLDLGRFFTCSQDLGFITDVRGAILATTAGAERALGYTQGELVGLDLTYLDEGGDLRRFLETVPPRSRINLSFHLRTRAGSAVAVGGAASCLRDEEGTPQGWFITGQDLRGAVAASRESPSILDALVDSIGAAVWSFDRNGLVVTWGRTCETVFGVSRSAAEGLLSVLKLFPSPAEFRRVVETVDRDGLYSGELPLVGADGLARPNHLSVTPLISGGFRLGYTCVSFDVAERKREEELRRAHFEQAGEAIVLVDLATRRVIDVNERACRIYGYSREEFSTLEVVALWPKPTGPVEEVDRRLRETGSFESDREMGRRKDGTGFPCALNIRSFSIGSKMYTVGVVRDLSAQERAEEFFRVLFEKSSDSIYLVEDQSQQVVEANEAACRMLGYTREEFLALKVPDLVPPELRHRIAGVRKHLAEAGGYQRDRRLLLRKDGTSVPCDHAITMLELGGRVYYLASSRDLTVPEQAAQELAEAKAFLEHVQENASDGFSLVDEKGVYLSVNQTLLNILGARREDMIGRSYQSRTDPKVQEEYQGYWQRLMNGEKIKMRTTILRPDGRSVICEVSSAPVRRGSRTFIFSIVRDVTDLVQEGERLVQDREELERRVAERTAELRQSEARFRAITEATPVPVTITRPDGQILFVNEAASRLFGVSREEAQGRLAGDFYADQADRERMKDRLAQDGELTAYELRLCRTDGLSFWTVVNLRVVTFEGGPAIFASFVDIDARKRAEEALRESEGRYRALAENTGVGVWQITSEGRTVYANPAMLSILGLGRAADLASRTLEEFVPRGILEKIKGEFRKRPQSLGFSTEGEILRPDGTRRQVVLFGAPMPSPDDVPHTFIGSFIDITERKRAELELRESEERFRAITEGVPVAVVIARASDGVILYGNEQAAESLGLAHGALEGRSVPEFLARPEDRELLLERLSGEGAPQGLEIQFRRADGALFWGAASLRLASFRGEPVTLGVFSDITARKESEVLLKKAHEELEQRVLERTAELARANTLLQEEISERKRAESALRLILEGTAAVTGGSFFRSLARHLASALEVRYAFVSSKRDDRPGYAMMVAVWDGSEFSEPFEYTLAGTPCEDVLAGEPCSYGHDVQRLFPQDQMLVDMRAESYLGVPMMDSSGKVVGLIAVLDVNPISDEDRKLSVLKIFAARAGSELERQQGEEALRQSEERWRSLVQNAPDFILTVDRDCRILSMNRTVSGLPMEKVLGQTVYDFVPPNFQKVVRDSLARVFRDGTPGSYETQAIGPDGTMAWYLTRVGPVVLSGEVTGATLIATDITERRQAERRQRVQHEATQILSESRSLEAALNGILGRVCDLMGWNVGLLWRASGGTLKLVDSWTASAAGCAEFVEANRDRIHVLGRGASGRAWQQRVVAFVLDVQRSDEFDLREAAAAAGLHTSIAVPLVDGDCVFGVLEFFTAETRMPDEALTLTVSALATQIGQFMQRKRAEETLRFQKSLLEAQSEAAIDGILVVARDGVMTSFNRRFTQMWDIPEDVLRSRTDERALQAVLDKLTDPQEFLDRVRYLYDHPNEESRDEVHLKDGRTFDRYSAPVKGEQGVLYGRVWYFRDVTGRKQTEENLRRAAAETRRAYEDLKEAQAQLIRSEKLASIGMLVSGVAHEINNPLNVMYGNLQLLAEVSDVLLPLSVEGARSRKVRGVASRVSKFRGMIRDALKAARHAREIVHDFRNFARDTRTAELVDLNECLEEAVTLIQRELRPGVRLQRKLGRIPQVRCLRGQMSQVFLNLLKNAEESIEKKGTVTLRTQKKDGHVVIEVADTGRGMPEEIRRKLFEPFFTTKPVGKGLGLGLSISAMIVQNHNGRITVRSRPGRGSVFRVELPLIT